MMIMMKCIFTCCIDCTTIVSYLSSNITAAATAAIICGRHNGEIARSNCDLREPEREDEGIDSSFHGQNRHHCAFAREVPFSVFLPKRFHTLLHGENELFMHHINTGHHFFRAERFCSSLPSAVLVGSGRGQIPSKIHSQLINYTCNISMIFLIGNTYKYLLLFITMISIFHPNNPYFGNLKQK